MNRVVKAAVAGALSLTLLVGVVSITSADNPTPTPTPRGQQQGWPGRGAAGHGAGFGYQALSGPVAQALGMTVEQIEAERLAGKSLAQIAAAKGVSQDKLVELMLAARKKILDDRVAAGTLTRAQADAALAQMKTRIAESVKSAALGPKGPAAGQGLGLGWGRMGAGSGNGQPGQGTGPGMGRRWGGAAR